MDKDEVLAVFRDCGAILEGHFILSSGLRSPVFLQKARVFMYPAKAELLCRALADKIRAAGYADVSKVVSPAIGGIIPGYETARHLGLPAIYTERVDGVFQVRRGSPDLEVPLRQLSAPTRSVVGQMWPSPA
jgi:orotate phosphoribosyltransferase